MWIGSRLSAYGLDGELMVSPKLWAGLLINTWQLVSRKVSCFKFVSYACQSVFLSDELVRRCGYTPTCTSEIRIRRRTACRSRRISLRATLLRTRWRNGQ